MRGDKLFCKLREKREKPFLLGVPIVSLELGLANGTLLSPSPVASCLSELTLLIAPLQTPFPIYLGRLSFPPIQETSLSSPGLILSTFQRPISAHTSDPTTYQSSCVNSSPSLAWQSYPPLQVPSFPSITCCQSAHIILF